MPATTKKNSKKIAKASTKVLPQIKPATAIEKCIENELRRYYNLLDGEEPSHMHRMVVRQAEFALIRSVMSECRGNQTKASEWLGISRGNLRNKLATMEEQQE